MTLMRWAQKMRVGYIMSRVCLRGSSFYYPFAIYAVACVQLAHLRLDEWKDIFISHLIIIIIKSEVFTFPITVIFVRGCVAVMVVLSTLFYHRSHNYPGNTGTLFPLLMYSLWYLLMIHLLRMPVEIFFFFVSLVCKSHHLIIVIMQTYLKVLNY